MNVLLINPPLSFNPDNSPKNEEARFFPEGLAVVASSLRQSGHSVVVADLERQPDADLGCRSVDLIGVTGTLSHFSFLSQLIPRLREACPNAKIVLGGPLISTAPDMIAPLLDFDYAVVGEGELAILSLVEQLTESSGSSLTGKIILHGGNLSPSDFVEPAWDLFGDLSWYLGGETRPHMKAVGISGGVLNNMMVSRGCPHRPKCGFCGQFFGHKVRCKPDWPVKAELDAWHRSGAEAIRFQDDNLTTLPADTQSNLFSSLEELEISWLAHSRVDTVSSEKLGQMRRAGCKVVYYGVETFSEQALSLMGKGASTIAAKSAVEMAAEAGIWAGAFFLLGLPGETAESLETMVDFVAENRILASPYLMCPIPGTPLFEMAQGMGKIQDIRTFLMQCHRWEADQVEQGRLFVNLTDLPDKLLLETYAELQKLGRG